MFKRKWLTPVLITAFLTSLMLAGFFERVEGSLMDHRFRLIRREATAQIVVVQIDSYSLQELDVWPWPREYHAQLLDRLTEAGASNIAFDIDFSSNTNESADQAFVRALRRAGGSVILPTFQQLTRPGQREANVSYTEPLAQFREHSWLGGVNIYPAADGVVRQYAAGEYLDDKFRPSMFALLADSITAEVSKFYVDYSIAALSIPRLSYVDVLRGNFSAADVLGRAVIVGAVAAEVGDMLTVPNGRVMPGPVLQALAYESHVQDRKIHRTSPILTIVITLILSLSFTGYIHASSWIRNALAGVAVIFVIQALALVVQIGFPVSVDTVPWQGAIFLSFLYNLIRKIEGQAWEILNRGLMISSIYEGAFDGIILCDSRGTIKICNQAAATIFGLSIAELGQSNLSELLPRAATEKICGMKRAIRQSAIDLDICSAPVEIDVTRKDGSQIVVELVLTQATKIGDRAGPGPRKNAQESFVHTLRDVSQRKIAEREINEAKELAIAADKAKSEFLANMSHELRTPLNAILGFSDIIKAQTFGPVGSIKYRDYAADIHDSGQHLLSLINDILDLSKVEAGTNELNEEAIETPNVIQSALKLVRQSAEGAGLEIVLELADDLPLLYADERKLQQILVNLLSNAIKFTQAGGKVTLRAWCQATTGHVFQVIDTGIGIALDDIPKALSQFGQVDGNLNRKYEGTGLGLPLTKALVELHGGYFDLLSHVGVGTTVTVGFPAERIVSLLDDTHAWGVGDHAEKSDIFPQEIRGHFRSS